MTEGPQAPEEDAGLLVGRVVVERYASPDGDLIDYVQAVDGQDEDLPLVEALGMMRLAEDTLIRMRMDDA